jgi:dolichol-phosphate mannosyltransferase
MSSRLSVVIPVLNEEEIVPELVRRVIAVLDELPGGPHELVIVNDGSTDATAEQLDQAAARDPRLVIVHLSRNFGHQIAISAGLDHTSGDWVAILDGDLQDPPEVLPGLLQKAAEGFDVVYARRVRRKEGIVLRVCYFIAYRLIAALSDTAIPLDSGDFGLMSRRVVDAIRASPEHHRFVRGLRAWVGFRQVAVEVERHERAAGAPKYTVRKLMKLTLDGLLAFSTAPLRATMLLGLLALCLAAGYLGYALWARLATGQVPSGFTALLAAVVGLSGVQFLVLGLVGEYVGRIYEQVKGRPLYVVARVERSPATD